MVPSPVVPSKVRKKVEWLLRCTEGGLLGDALLAAEGAHLAPREAREKLRANAEPAKLLGVEARVDELLRALDSGDAARKRAYVERHGVAGVRRFPTAGADARLYQLAVETFPRHINNVYVVVQPGLALMFDCGTMLETSQRDLRLGFAVLRAELGESVRYEELDVCVISHAHIDHFGGVNLVKEQTRARLAVHELDARVLSMIDERLVVASKDVDVFWRQAGVPDEERTRMLTLYADLKRLVRPEEVDHVLRDGDAVGPGCRVHHVPGHCPGLVCLQVHDVLLTSDHVLSRITPHQFPQAITPFGGLEHYFQSLTKVRNLTGIRYALGGHEEPIWELPVRVDEIALFHRQRLEKVWEICATPQTMVGVAEALFGAQEEYGKILAVEEAGAHVEYLHEHGRLEIANLDAVRSARDPVLQYLARG